MEDSCSPGKNKSLQTHRIYSIIMPSALAILILEAVYVIGNIPGNLGSALTIKGPLPPLPSAPSAPKGPK
jgi:hypothetical protein